MRRWGCRVFYHSKPESKLESRVKEGTFILYSKSDRQYYVIPRGSESLRLVTNPEFRKRERGYLEELKSAPLTPMPMDQKSSDVRPNSGSGMMDKPANPLSADMDMDRNKPSNASGIESQGEKSTPIAQREELPDVHMADGERPSSSLGAGAEQRMHAESSKAPNQVDAEERMHANADARHRIEMTVRGQR